jgi:hypothetical protein
MLRQERAATLGLLVAFSAILLTPLQSRPLPQSPVETRVTSPRSNGARLGPSSVASHATYSARRDPARARSQRAPKYPPRRCAALIDGRTQCSRNAIEPTDYCAGHQKRAPRSRRPRVSAAGAASVRTTMFSTVGPRGGSTDVQAGHSFPDRAPGSQNLCDAMGVSAR